MLPINAQLASMLASAFRAPRVYGVVTLPLVTSTSNTVDYTKTGQQLTLDHILAARRESILEPGSDILDFSLSSQNGEYSPFTLTSPYGQFFFPGVVDNTIQLYIGLSQNGAETVLPKGVFIIDSFNQDSNNGLNTASVNTFDQMYLFQGEINAQFPPRLYGAQNSAYYNPNYALTPINASGGTATKWQCDAVNWMQSSSDNKVWATDFVTPTVYCSDEGSGATPSARSLSIDYVNGIVTFGTAISTSITVSVDARPLGMAPEKMLQHLFVDFGSLAATALQFDKSGIILPIMEIARDRTILDVAKDIAFSTAPKGARWRFYFNEYGSLIFTEDSTDGPPVRTLTDQFDILAFRPEYGTQDLHNVIRAQGRCITDQPLTVIAFNALSISTYAQRATFDVPSQLLATLVGMDPGSALAYLNGLVAAFLFEYDAPTIQLEADIVPDPSLQVNDLVNVIENKTGISKPFQIVQITDDIQNDTYNQTLKLQQFKAVQDWMFGLNAYVGAPLPANPTQIQAATGLIQAVSINGTSVVSGGEPVLDLGWNEILASWDGKSNLPISITLGAAPASANTYIWRWIYIGEDPYVTHSGAIVAATGNGTAAGLAVPTYTNKVTYPMPYSVANNADTPRARRYWRPLLRCSDWLSGDGVTAYTSLTTLNSTWTGGVGATNPTVQGELIVGLSNYFSNTSSGFVGQQLYATGTPAATALGAASTVSYGVDFGPAITGTIYYGINKKVTPAYLCILAANTAGAVQYKRIPFNISL